MNSLTKVDDEWIPLQAKVFSRWVSIQLKGSQDSNVKDITKDLSNGVALVELAEKLTHKKASRNWDEKPETKIENTQNCDLAIDMFSKDGVKIVGISGKDISDHNEKLILGLIWSLIQHYSIGNLLDLNNENNKVNNPKGRDKSDAPTSLIAWAIKRTENYQNIKSFQPYDLAMCALLDTYYPDKIHYSQLNPEDHRINAQLACDVMKEIGINCYIYPEDLIRNDNKIDQMTLLTQLAAARSVLNEKSLIKKVESEIKAKEEKVKEEDHVVTEEQRRLAQEDEENLKKEEEEKRKKEEEDRIKNDQQIIESEAQRETHEAEQMKKEEQTITEENDKIKADYESRINRKLQAQLNAKAKKERAKQKQEDEERLRNEWQNQLKANEEKRLMAEYEARVLADEEARRQAANDDKIRAEYEARIKADEEERLIAEEEARVDEEEAAKIEEEANRLKAEYEAEMKKKSGSIKHEASFHDKEDEERLKAEQEARIKADEMTRLKAIYDAKQKFEQDAELCEKEAKKAEEDEKEAEEELDSQKVNKQTEVGRGIEARVDAIVRAEKQTRNRIEHEAKLRAEAEKRAQEEEEARIKAEQRADLIQKENLELLNKLKEAEEARAAAEAKAKAELEAKIRAESEIKKLESKKAESKFIIEETKMPELEIKEEEPQNIEPEIIKEEINEPEPEIRVKKPKKKIIHRNDDVVAPKPQKSNIVLDKYEERKKRANLIAACRAQVAAENEEKEKHDDEKEEIATEIEKPVVDINESPLENRIHVLRPSHKDYKIHIRYHRKIRPDQPKEMKLNIKINDPKYHGSNKNHLVCERVSYVTKRNGKVIPSTINGSVVVNGQKKPFTVDFL